jgi:MFS family permease
MIVWLKRAEIGIMALASWAFFVQNIPLLLASIFLMGLQSTVFGPVKFAYLPQHLSDRELTGGNGMVEMGTFVAILLGNVAGGLIIAVPEIGAHHVGFACVGLAILGRATAHYIPASPAMDPGLKINWNPITETWANLQLARQTPVVFRSLLGISWMWFLALCSSACSLRLPKTCCMATSRWPRCCWWCSRSALAPARCCARCCRAVRSRLGWSRWVPSA